MDRSACGVSVSVSLALLLALFGSVTPAGGDTVAVFTSLPVTAGLMVPVTLSVMRWPVARVRPVHRPVPLVYVPVLGVKAAPRRPGVPVSVRVRLVMVLGPLLVTAMV